VLLQFLAGACQERPDGGSLSFVPQDFGRPLAHLGFRVIESADQLLRVTAGGGDSQIAPAEGVCLYVRWNDLPAAWTKTNVLIAAAFALLLFLGPTARHYEIRALLLVAGAIILGWSRR